MAENFINQTEGFGKKSHTWDRTIGANAIHDEFVLPGEFPYASYTIPTSGGVATTTANSHILQIMAGATLPVRVRRIRIRGRAFAGAVTPVVFEIWRLSTAGTGGTAITPAKLDTADGAAGATAMTLPTVKGTETTMLWSETTVAGVAATPHIPGIEWIQLPNSKPIIIPAGTANGIAVKNPTGLATFTVDVDVEIVETNFV